MNSAPGGQVYKFRARAAGSDTPVPATPPSRHQLACLHRLATGILLLGTGLAAYVVWQGIMLFHAPHAVTHLAAMIEAGSGIDHSLFSQRPAHRDNPTGTGASGSRPRISYFIAWIVSLLVLQLLAMIAFASIRCAGRLFACTAVTDDPGLLRSAALRRKA